MRPKGLKEMCIYIRYSMGIIEKAFHYEESKINVVKCNDDIWLKGRDIAIALGYENPGKAIKGGPKSGLPSETNYQRSTIYINESGLYTLIFTSKLESAKIFMKWVTSEILPSIRKTGSYVMPIDVGHKFNNALTFRIENETDLHVKVVSFLKKRFPYSIFVAPLGENQDTSIKRIDSFNKGYIKGTPDLIIKNLHRYCTCFAIEFKTPKGIIQ